MGIMSGIKNLLGGENPNIEEGELFLKRNSVKADVAVTASGLQYKVITEGSGDKPEANSTVNVHYEGRFLNGEVFDSSYERGEPISFPLGGVIAGWTEGLQLMMPGAKYELYIPYHLAYGKKGSPPVVPPCATLIFQVELLEVI